MLFISAPLMTLSAATLAIYARNSGLVVPDTVLQSLQSLVPPLDIWMFASLIVLFVGIRLVIPSLHRTRWLLVSVLLLSVSSSAFAFFPSDATHDLARQLSAAAPLWSFIKHGIIEPAPTRYCFDRLGNLARLLDPTKEAKYLRCFDASAVLESPETTAPDYQLTCDYDTVYARSSCLSRFTVHTVFEFGSSLRFSWIHVLTCAVFICLIVIVYKLYSSNLELTVALEKRDEASSMGAEYSRQERAFYRKRVSTLSTTNAGLIAALDSALPKITASDLQCAQARAHANQLEVALDDLKDAHADEVRTLKTAVITLETKVSKASAHARSLMKTVKAQRSTIASLRASVSHLVRKCNAQDDVIATLTSEKERLETMVHHLRIGIAKLAAVSQEPSIDMSASEYAEESEAVAGPYLDYEDFLNFASFQDSLCDFVDEEENDKCSDAASVRGSSPSSIDTESPPHTPVSDLGGEEVAMNGDAQIVKLCKEMHDLKLTDSFLLEALADVLSPCDAPPASDVSFWKMIDCLSEDAPICCSPLTATTATKEALVASPSTFEYPGASSSAPFGSSPSLSTFQAEPVLDSTSEALTSFPAASSSTSATDSSLAPSGSSPAIPAVPRMEHLFECTIGDISLEFAYPPQSVVSFAEPLSLFTPVRRLPSSASPPLSSRQWLMYSPSYAAVMPGTPDYASKGKAKPSTTTAHRPFANKENVMPL